MKIDMNKDFEEQYKTEYKGLTGGQILSGAIALLAAGAIAILVRRYTGLPINTCMYFGIPAMFPIIGMGMLKYQGQGMFRVLKEIRFFMKTRRLMYKAEELTGERRIFTMKSRANIRSKGGKKNGAV